MDVSDEVISGFLRSHATLGKLEVDVFLQIASKAQISFSHAAQYCRDQEHCSRDSVTSVLSHH